MSDESTLLRPAPREESETIEEQLEMPSQVVDRRTLLQCIAGFARLLPTQGPIGVFVHHNPLHAFEDSPFESAVLEAKQLFGFEPYWPHARYIQEYSAGRITLEDIREVIGRDLGSAGDEELLEGLSRRVLLERLCAHGINEARGAELKWLLEETDALKEYRKDILSSSQELKRRLRPSEREVQLNQLWQLCLKHAGEGEVAKPTNPRPERLRDIILERSGVDTDEWVHGVLIRFISAYLDQGIAYWPMPERGRGIWHCFTQLFAQPGLPGFEPWFVSARRRIRQFIEFDPADALIAVLEELGYASSGNFYEENSAAPRLAADQVEGGREQLFGADALATGAELSIEPSSASHSELEAVSVRAGHVAFLQLDTEPPWSVFLRSSLFALSGWAGMVHQVEKHRDCLPYVTVQAALLEFLAVRMVLELGALEYAGREILGYTGPLAGLEEEKRAEGPSLLAPEERAWLTFNASQICGLESAVLSTISPEKFIEFEREILQFTDERRRWVMHRAFELRFRKRAYSALLQHTPPESPEPGYQLLACIDDREESLRRHLEEVDPHVETYGYAGFFGVAMYFHEADHARPMARCPAPVHPEHIIREAPEHHEGAEEIAHRAADLVRTGGRWSGMTLVRGALLSLFGSVALIPLIFRVLFPGMRNRTLHRHPVEIAHEPEVLLEGEESAQAGVHEGYSLDEMVEVVSGVLLGAGMTRLSPLVVVLGHTATSVNNPHQSAYACGACGGMRGGANARVFAAMANRAAVRERLSEVGINIPEDTWFIGGEHDTTRDSVAFYDVEALPAARRAQFAEVREKLETALERNAQERARRFPRVSGLSPAEARAHVEGRSADLAQPRPEYNHATNALAVIGRRARTRGLFLDRRAFLVSYDPENDAGGAILAKLMSAAVPVAAGINLEYLFGTIDNRGHGSGTKLPHNVASLLGVMNGAQSDLLTGLWAQTVEIHEPVRLSVVVEAERSVVERLIQTQPGLRRLVVNQWIFLAVLDPSSSRLWEYADGGFHAYEAEQPLPKVGPSSAAWYQGKSGYLPFASIIRPGAELEAQA